MSQADGCYVTASWPPRLVSNMISLGVFTQWRLDIGHPQTGWARVRKAVTEVLRNPGLLWHVPSCMSRVSRTHSNMLTSLPNYEWVTWLCCVSRLHVLPGVTGNPHSSMPTVFRGNYFLPAFLKLLRCEIKDRIGAWMIKYNLQVLVVALCMEYLKGELILQSSLINYKL